MNRFTVHDVRAHPGDSAFLLVSEDCAILYDSGFGFTGFAVAEKIKGILGEQKLDYIFLTHSHYDHALGSAYVLRYWPEAKVAAGEYAAGIFKKPTAKAVMRDLDRKFAAKCGVSEYEDLADELRVDILLSDGDVISAGGVEFRALSLPGHTKCSVGFYCEAEKLLLGCESIGNYDGEGDVVPAYLVGYQAAISSIERVEKLDIRNILVPHYGLLNEDETHMYLKRAKESAVETAEGILNILRSGGTKEDALGFFRDKYYHGYVCQTYPVDAMELNTGIMVELLKREFDLG